MANWHLLVSLLKPLFILISRLVITAEELISLPAAARVSTQPMGRAFVATLFLVGKSQGSQSFAAPTAVYLQECGYNSQIVGLVTGIGALLSVLLQPILASLLAKNPKMSNQGNVLFLKLVTMIMGVVMMLNLPGFYTVAIIFTLLAALEASIPSILSSIAMECVNAGIEINYGFARGMGSVLYAIFSLFLGYAVSFWGAKCLMLLYLGTSILTIGMVYGFKRACGQMNSAAKTSQNEKSESMLSLFGKYSYLKYFLTGAVLLFMSHNMVCVFLPMIIENAGGDSSKLGMALAISAGVEFPVMAYFAKLSKKVAVDKLLIMSAIFFTIKSGVALIAGSVSMVYLAQFLQFGGFALFTPASVYFINLSLKEEDRNVGQALLGSCTLGLGGTFGNVLGGMILENAGLGSMLTVSTAFCLVGIVLMIASRNRYLKANLKKV